MSLQIGPDYVEVIDVPLDITKYTGLVADPGAGAISTFSGVTRNNFQGKAVVKLEYEAYVPMAVKKLAVGWVPHVGGRRGPDGAQLQGKGGRERVAIAAGLYMVHRACKGTNSCCNPATAAPSTPKACGIGVLGFP